MSYDPEAANNREQVAAIVARLSPLLFAHWQSTMAKGATDEATRMAFESAKAAELEGGTDELREAVVDALASALADYAIAWQRGGRG